ncbi:hypothetical protein [Oceanobacillus indicireducens]|uniref:Uncharacterized protein n=1 Tax=Oceanobacillus indicireducens TaxID=1004261 RepID=A0A917XUZ8_9BACI|nr:hypothetical protein [Oceanobacillus indicireducens]GGN55048.1 hypothetical protein GCM10007971_13450 [Oceanobacillus indicireducens]
MNFTLHKLKAESFPKQKGIIKKSWQLFSKKEEDVSLFNWNEIEKNKFHIVFHISDEYISRTKKGGNEKVLPFSQYINAFLIEDNFFIETNNKNYLSLIINFLKTEHKLDPISMEIDNELLLEIIKQTNGFLKKFEYVNDEDNDFFEENLKYETLIKILNTPGNEFEFVNFLYKNTFISIYRNGKISINSNDEDELLQIIEEVSNAVS